MKAHETCIANFFKRPKSKSPYTRKTLYLLALGICIHPLLHFYLLYINSNFSGTKTSHLRPATGNQICLKSY